MLITSRRVALVHFCLAGMDTAWFTPLVMLAWRGAWGWPLLAAWLGFYAVLLSWMLALDLMARRRVETPGYELAVLGLIVVSSLLLARMFLYPDRAFSDLAWLPHSLSALADFGKGIRPEWGLLAANLFLWQRAASATGREMSFFSVGLSFRLDMLLLIFSAGIYGALSRQDATPLLWAYFVLGLVAVSVMRIHERAASSRSSGTPLPMTRLAQVLAAVAVTVGATIWLSVYFNPGGIRVFLAWFQPLWDVLRIILLVLLQVILWLLMPVLLKLEEWVRGMNIRPLADVLRDITGIISAEQAQRATGNFEVPGWIVTVLRDLGVILVVAIGLGIVLLYLERVRRQRVHEEAEEEAGEKATLGGGIAARGLQRLRELAGLVRRFGVGGQLLAAVSVQNIYANLCRLARRRGYPRLPAQPPDDYLPTLAKAFGGQQEQLSRITTAYMRVHYGDQPVTLAELARIRADYHEVRSGNQERSD